MLSRLKLKNFKSFMEERAIDLKATGYEILSDTNKSEDGILKGALIVGTNASGKSTIIETLKFLLEFLVWQVNVDLGYYVCRFPDAMLETSEVEYEFNINDNKIIYSIEFNSTEIICERLILNDNPILDRIKNTAKYEKVVINQLESNQSALRKVYFDTKFNNNEVLKNLFSYLEKSVYINQANKNIMAVASTKMDYKDYFKANGVNEFNDFLNKINYKQTVKYTVQIAVQNNKNGEIVTPVGEKDIFFKRDDMDFELPLKLESEGNNTLVRVLPYILKIIKSGGMLIIDEFSSAFHNLLEEKILKTFMQKSKNAQIFIVSHSTNLLSNTIMRPDQIYTVDFDGEKGSRINRVSERKPREAQNLEKMYLSGVFDGLPKYN